MAVGATPSMRLPGRPATTTTTTPSQMCAMARVAAKETPILARALRPAFRNTSKTATLALPNTLRQAVLVTTIIQGLMGTNATAPESVTAHPVTSPTPSQPRSAYGAPTWR